MQNTWPIRLAFTLGLLALAGYFLYPTIVYFGLDEQARDEVRQDTTAFKQHVPDWAPTFHVVPGLDLQGGVHMVLGVDLDKAVSDKARRIAMRLRSELEDKKIAFTAVDHLAEVGDGDRVRIVFADEAARAAFEKDVREDQGDLADVATSGLEHVYRVHPDWVAKIKTDAVDQTIKTITNRIDKLHVTEPSITKRGDDQVQVQLPGFNNPEEAKSLIGRTAQLEFQMLDDDADFLTKLTDLPEWATLERSGFQRPDSSYANDVYLEFPEDRLKDMRAYLVGKVPSGLQVKYSKLTTRPGQPARMRTYTLNANVELTGEDLVDARVAFGTPEQPRPSVSVEFSPTGRIVFGELTTKSVGKRMAIVLEDLVDSAPVINEPITGGTASITMGGSRTPQEMIHDANQLALVLKAGALPAPVTFREERTVGPSLGRDALEGAQKAIVVGLLAVFAYLIFYYKIGGLISVVAIGMNLVFVMSILSWLGATITLPGIAGLLLTVGMADDANVIINERIRDELRAGKTPRAAVQAGFGNALSAILDSNVTTFIAGLVLWQYGSGPIQNFATTLMIGIISSLFTGIFVSRIFFDMYASKNRETLAL